MMLHDQYQRIELVCAHISAFFDALTLQRINHRKQRSYIFLSLINNYEFGRIKVF